MRLAARWFVLLIGVSASAWLALPAVVASASEVSLTTDVTLVVDGSSATFTVPSDTTVAGLLDQASVSVTSTDIVTPSLGSTVVQTVTVEHTVAVAVVESGDETTKYVASDTVGAAYTELGLLQLAVASRTDATSDPYDVEHFLRLRAVDASGARLVRADQLTPGTTILVKHVRVNYPDDLRRVAFSVHRVKDPLTPQGDRVVVHDGRGGIRDVLLRKVHVDGVRRSTSVLQRTWSRRPIRKFVRVGTGPNWYALARCESGGDLNAYSPAGPYYGLYQFLKSTWREYGGTGLPSDHGRREQTRIAWHLYRARGTSPWATCGTRL